MPVAWLETWALEVSSGRPLASAGWGRGEPLRRASEASDALRDLAPLRDVLGPKNAAAAARCRTIRWAAATLRERPELGRVVEDEDWPEVLAPASRSAYVLRYRIDEDAVVIARVPRGPEPARRTVDDSHEHPGGAVALLRSLLPPGTESECEQTNDRAVQPVKPVRGEFAPWLHSEASISGGREKTATMKPAQLTLYTC